MTASMGLWRRNHDTGYEHTRVGTFGAARRCSEAIHIEERHRVAGMATGEIPLSRLLARQRRESCALSCREHAG